VVVIAPFVALGRAVIRATAIPTAVIVQRYERGESIDDLF
jgi:uncharacterized protein (DUF433 family)